MSTPEPFIPPAPISVMKGSLHLPLDLIDVPKRLRAVRQPHVEFFKAAIADEGFRGAITVRPAKADGRYELVAGAHRLEAMLQLGRAEIPVDVQDMTDDEAELWEINENLVRHELNAKDRAVFLMTAKRIRQRIDENSRRGGDRRSTKVQTLQFDPTPFPQSFSAEMAEKLGIGSRTVLADIAFAERLHPDVLTMLDDTAIVDNRSKLIELSRKTSAQQRALATQMRDSGAKTIAQAAVLAGFEEAPSEGGDPQGVALAQLHTAWAKADPATKLTFLADIDAAYLTAPKDDSMTPEMKKAIGWEKSRPEDPSAVPSRGGRKPAKATC